MLDLDTSWRTDRYTISLHRAIYLATGDQRCRYAARPHDPILRSFRGVAREISASFRLATAEV